MDRYIHRSIDEYLETLHLALMQFCDLSGFYFKTELLKSNPLSLNGYIGQSTKILLLPLKYEKIMVSSNH